MMCRPTNRQGRLSASRPQHMILGSECFQGDLGAGWKCSVNVALHWNRPVVCRPTNRGTRALISARAKFGVSEGSRLRGIQGQGGNLHIAHRNSDRNRPMVYRPVNRQGPTLVSVKAKVRRLRSDCVRIDCASLYLAVT